MNNAVQQRLIVPAEGGPRSGEVRTITSEQLMRGERVIVILHGHKEYRLQVTANEKLILTK